MASVNKNSNIIRVEIYDGLKLFAKCDTFTDLVKAQVSTKRIINHQKMIDPSTTAYAVIWYGKNMINYID